jgi:SAM-dependent methyltransferase
MSSTIERRSSYACTNHQDYLYDKYLREFLINAISNVLKGQISRQFHVLDIGCGEQPLRPLIEEHGADYKSVDITQNRTRSVDFLVDMSSPIAHKKIPGQFDLILLSEVLEHVPDPFTALLNIKQLLAPSGRAVITTPFVWPLHEQPQDYQRLTSYWFDKHVASAGLRVIVNQSLGTPIDVLITLLQKTHIFADSKSRVRPSQSKLYAYMIRKMISILVLVLSIHTRLGIMSSSSLYLVNCLVLSHQ